MSGFIQHDHAEQHKGVVPQDQLGSGTATAATFLRGDQTYAHPLTKLAGLTTAVIQTAYAHGLSGTPTVVIVMARGNVIAWESANADATNIYLTGSGISTVDAYVAL